MHANFSSVLTQDRNAYIYIHLAVALFGFTAILGGLINLPAIMIVWWRVLITSLSLLFFVNFGRRVALLPRPLVRKYLFIGAIIGLHWVTFYGAIKLANASVTLICMSTTSLFTSFLEPVIVRTRFKPYELWMGLMIVPAMILIVSDLDASFHTGIAVGILSALLAAVFSSLNKLHIQKADPYTITFIELSGAWAFLSVLLIPAYFSGIYEGPYLPKGITDIVWIIVLALLCTTLAQVLTLKALRVLSTYATNLVINLEPVYGILLAAFVLNEHKDLNTSFYTGSLMILAVILVYPLISKRLK